MNTVRKVKNITRITIIYINLTSDIFFGATCHKERYTLWGVAFFISGLSQLRTERPKQKNHPLCDCARFVDKVQLYGYNEKDRKRTREDSI